MSVIERHAYAGCVAALLWTLLAALPLFAQSARGAPDLDEIATAGVESMNRLESSNARWEVVHTGFGEQRYVMSGLQARGRTHWAFYVEASGQTYELLRLIIEEDAWYVKEAGGLGKKYRPFEAPLKYPFVYLCLLQSYPRVVTDPAMLQRCKFETMQNGVASYRAAITAEAQKGLKNSRKLLLDKTNRPNRREDRLYREQMARYVDELLQEGHLMKVDIRTGLLMQFGDSKHRVELRNLQYLDFVDEGEVDPGRHGWEDHTKKLSKWNANQTAMLMHAPGWRPGMPNPDMEAVLLNLKTGDCRRVPYHGASTMTGCFSKNRKLVFVPGIEASQGALQLVEIDFAEGASRALAQNIDKPGFWAFPTLSNDGKKLVALHKEAPRSASFEDALKVQLYIIDIPSCDATPIGKPLDTNRVYWLPGDEELLLVTREYPDRSKPSVETISRMNLKGRITPIRKGSSPVLVEQGRRILFQDQADELWYTCDLEGNAVKKVGNGLRRLGFPTASPSGKTLLMIRFDAEEGPTPVKVRLSDGRITELDVGPGMWSVPAWR